MAKLSNRLSARGIQTAKAGRHADGNGLYLIVDEGGARRWAFFFHWHGARKEMGLGRLADVSLSNARDAAEAARKQVRAGVNPVAARKASRAAVEAKTYTFGTFAEELVNSIDSEFRSEVHKAQWRFTLSVQRDEDGAFIDTGHALKLRNLGLDEIGTDEVLAVLTPLWGTIPETASRLRGRIERVLDAAKVRGLRTAENPARWKGHLSALLPKRQKLTRGHHRALPYQDLPALVARLHGSQAMAALALEWTILTAARTSETLLARMGEIDREALVWTVPGTRMKAGRDHRVPLTPRTLELVDAAAMARDQGGTDLLFPGATLKGPMSQMTMTALLRRFEVNATVHGFRSAFRDWVGDATDFDPTLAEAALAHVIGDATERAYRRGDALERRRKLMDGWETFCLSACLKADDAALEKLAVAA